MTPELKVVMTVPSFGAPRQGGSTEARAAGARHVLDDRRLGLPGICALEKRRKRARVDVVAAPGRRPDHERDRLVGEEIRLGLGWARKQASSDTSKHRAGRERRSARRACRKSWVAAGSSIAFPLKSLIDALFHLCALRTQMASVLDSSCRLGDCHKKPAQGKCALRQHRRVVAA